MNPACPQCKTPLEYISGRPDDYWECPECGYSRILGEFPTKCMACGGVLLCKTGVTHEDVFNTTLSFDIKVDILNPEDHPNCFPEEAIDQDFV